jgi:hypothetical protein
MPRAAPEALEETGMTVTRMCEMNLRLWRLRMVVRGQQNARDEPAPAAFELFLVTKMRETNRACGA